MRRRLRDFIAMEASGGIVMIAAAAVALLLANSPWSAVYFETLHRPLTGHFSLSDFINDVLMAIFFFAVGLELKSEMREGALAAPGQKVLPLIAAIGGVLVPACFYLTITAGEPHYQAGWAIPTATDIAFALCILRLAGPAIPHAAKMFLLAIAIYDDLLAILIIAVFYASGLALIPLLIVVGLSASLWLLNRLHIGSVIVYLAVGIALWFAAHSAGIHPTIAGVITAIAIPMRRRDNSPLITPLLHRLHPAVAFLILPLFALASAGVDLRALTLSDALSPLPLGIAVALFFGKQIGILLATFGAVRGKLASLPQGMDWRMVYAVAVIAGIGFTMSLFIGQLAFSAAAEQNEVKLGVLAGSLLSAILGLILLKGNRQR